MGWLEHGFSPTLISIPHFLSLINIPFLPVQQPRLAQHLSEQGGRWYPGWGRGCGSTGASQRKTWSCCDPPQQNQNALKSKKSAMLGFTGTSEGCWREMKPRASLRRPGETEARRDTGKHLFWSKACGAGGPSLLPSPAL